MPGPFGIPGAGPHVPAARDVFLMILRTASERTLMTVTHTVTGSPLGHLTLVADDGCLTGVYFRHHWYRPDPAEFGVRTEAGLDEVSRQLGEYFAGDRDSFDLLLDARGDQFQRRVWDLIGRIPYGQTASYGELALQLGDGALAKDVGAAVARNPLCVIVPCHRVVGKDGRLTGYAGGLARKRFLLDLEQRVAGTAGLLSVLGGSRSAGPGPLPNEIDTHPFDAAIA